jgi:putative nucleotidyltransferase with HDIG domain
MSPEIVGSRGFLRTRVARRILLLFLLCAILPLSLLAVLGYRRVAADLEQSARDDLRQQSKSAGMMLLDRLSSLATMLETIATTPELQRPGVRLMPASTASQEGPRFRAMAIVGPDGGIRSLFGDLPDRPTLLPDQEEHLAAGGVVLASLPGPHGPNVFLVRAIDPLPRARLWGWIEPASVWATDPGHSVAPPGDLMCLTQADRVPLNCQAPESSGPRESVDQNANFRWQRVNEQYLAGQWTLFLRRSYAAPSWIISLSVPEQRVFAPLAALRRSFALGLVLALAVVFTLAHVQLRRSMQPLEALEAGTRRVAEGRFDEPVVVQSDDEFAALGESFNRMAGSLGQQFRLQAGLQHVHQAALLAAGPSPVLEAMFRSRSDLLPGTGLIVALPSAEDAQVWTVNTESSAMAHGPPRQITLERAEREELLQHPEGLLLPAGECARSYFQRPGERLKHGALIIPLVRAGQCAGALVIHCAPSEGCATVLADARRRAAELAVAISNTQVVEQLEALNWGALTALARTIDAASPWTAGHSERVTLGAIAIGETLGLAPSEIELLRRGGLLHDIGKIGVPTTILDKPAALTSEEFAIVKTHPTIGARILSPIAAYREVLPLVRHHHELLDGTGYPDGLRGEEIPRLVRIMTVADVFDALVSERPYRPAWTVARAIEHLRAGAGIKFDGEAVEALASRTDRGWRPASTAGASLTDPSYVPAVA